MLKNSKCRLHTDRHETVNHIKQIQQNGTEGLGLIPTRLGLIPTRLGLIPTE